MRRKSTSLTGNGRNKEVIREKRNIRRISTAADTVIKAINPILPNIRLDKLHWLVYPFMCTTVITAPMGGRPLPYTNDELEALSKGERMQRMGIPINKKKG
jgi:hypothetical protein